MVRRAKSGTLARRTLPRTVLIAALLVIAGLAGSFSRGALADPSSPLAVTKTANPSPVASGDQLTYTINITNTGGAKLSNLVMTDQVNGVGVIQSPPALPQLQITSTQGSCSLGGPNGNVVTCNGGDLPGGATWTITIRGQVTAADGTTLNNTASVSATKSAQTFSTSATVQVLVQGGTGTGPQPDLTINKKGPSSVATSSPITYTLTVNNIGNANAANVKVVDTVPADVTGISASGTSLFVCNVSGQTVTCTGGAVNAGANATITIMGISPGTEGAITNTAVVDPDNTISESNELNNTSAQVNTSVGLPPSAPLLQIVKTDGDPEPGGTWWTGAGPDPVTPGQEITYKLQVTNNATGNNSRANDVVVTDGTQGLDASSITATQVVVNGTVGNTGGCVVTAPQVRCSIRSLDSGGTLTITIKGTVIASAGSTIFNTAVVTGNIKNTGVTSSDSEATTVKPAVDLTITKADAPDPVCARSWPIDGPPNQHLDELDIGLGSDASGTPTALLAPPVCLGGLTYSFVVGNSGIFDATDVVVRDPLADGLIFDSYSTDAGFTCVVDGSNVITCSGGLIPAESVRNLQFRVVAPPATGQISNTAYVDPNNAIFEADETNNTAVAATTVATGIDLVIWKSDSVQADPPGDGAPTLIPGTNLALNDGYDPIATRGTETVTIYVDNVGTQDSTGIRVRDTLPADTIFLSVIADATHGFTCSHDGSPTGGTVECVGGHLLGTESEFYNPAGPAPAGPGDDFATIKIRFFARATVGTMHNEARVDPLNEIAEANELNNLATDDTTVTVGDADKGAYHQLTVKKTHFSPAAGTVATNGILIYDLEVSNLGTDPVSNIVLADTLPSGTRFIEAKDTDTGTDAFFCSHDGSATGGVITCTGGDLDGSINTIPVGGTSRHVRVKVFAPNAPGSYTNLATVDPNNIVPEGNEFDNDSQLQTTVAPCTSLVNCTDTNSVYELTISKEQNRATIARNALETYTLTITNWGSDPVSDIVVQDKLPAGALLLDAKDTAAPASPDDFTCGSPDASNVITCIGGDLSGTNPALAIPGVPTSRQIVIRVFMPDLPGTYTNQAIVDPFNAVPEGNEFNNVATVQTEVQNGGPNPWIDLSIAKTEVLLDGQEVNNDNAVGPTGISLVAPGDPIFYQLVVTNTGEGDAFNVTVRDFLPASSTFVLAQDTGAAGDPNQFACGLAPGETHTVECIGGTIPAGGSRTINVFTLAPEGLDQVSPNQGDIKALLINTAFVDPDNSIPEGNESNNEDFEQTIVRSKINLTVESKTGPDTAQQNQETDYVITVKNNKVWGQGDIAVDAVVVDTLPIGLIPLSVSANAANMLCSVQENPVNVVTCVGDLEPDQTVVITVHVFITASSGTMYNQACIDPDHTVDETNELDNCKIKTTNVGEPQPPPPPDTPNLLMGKTANKSTLTEGEQLIYTLTVSNVGTGDTTAAVNLVDNLPTQVTKVNLDPDAGWDCSASTATQINCTRPSLAKGAASSVRVTVSLNAGVTAPFDNTATVTGGGDTTPENNSASVTTSVGGAGIDLEIVSVTDSPDPVNSRPSELQYTIVAVNNGTTGAANAVVRVDLPDSGITPIGVAGTNGFNCVANLVVDPAGGTFDCTGSFDAAGGANDQTVITAIITVNSGAPDDLFVVATVDPDNVFAEFDEVNNFGFETTTVSGDVCTSSPCVDLVVANILDNPDPGTAPADITYTVDIVNVGDAAIPSSTVWDVHFLYSGAGSFTVTPPAGITCSVIGGDPDHVHCHGSGGGADPMDLAPFGGVQFTATVTGVPASSVSLDVIADVFGVIPEFDEANNLLTETTTVN